ncbi:MAG: formate dehydrogenase subunit alpha [SAR324 cluster bacterium]|nr:formate dehydrogenase subunit alpha [SAR324 cluster bacterium]
MKSLTSLAHNGAAAAVSTAGNGAVQVTEVDSICPYCGVGCALTYGVDQRQNRILYAKGRDGAANASRLCVKGRYGFDYATHAHRLAKPLIRKAGSYPKGALSSGAKSSNGASKAGGVVDYGEVMPHFREATWDEALDLAAGRLKEIRDTHGGEALAGFGSAKGTNEEAYLFQKLVRACFGSNNVDHCTRLCHASSVFALLEGMGSAAVTNVVRDIENADVALVTGCNPTENHPVAATFMKDAASKGTKLIVVNTRRPGIADFAALYLRPKAGTDVALYNGMMQVIIAEDLIDHAFIEERVEGFEELKAVVAEYTPQRVASITGIAADQVLEAARMFGSAKAAFIFWGMGISQSTNGTNNARCLIALAMLTGNVGRTGTGLHPLRGQNNVQGASDAGLIPMMYPDYQSVEDPRVHAKFEKYWGAKLSPKKGLTVTEIMHHALEGSIKGMYVMGENPFLSDPDTNKVRKALAALDFLVVQDIFLTETAEFADVILPASSAMEKSGTYTNTDRRVQIGRPALEMPGAARQDWELVCEIGSRMGYPMHYDSVSQVFDEFAACTEAYKTLNYENLGDFGKWYPCADPDRSEGEKIVFDKTFPSGKAKLVPAHVLDPDEMPSDDYPLVLNTGRVLEHWHTGVMTRRSRALDAIQPEAFVEVHPQDAENMALREGDWVMVSSRRGEITLKVRVGDRTQAGSIFIPMHFREAAANVLTNPAVDPWGKIPEFKFCAVQISKVAEPASGQHA